MKKFFTLIAMSIVALWVVQIQAVNNSKVPNYITNENFDGKTVLPTGWTQSNVVTGNGAFNLTTPVDRLNLTGSGSGNRGIGFTGITNSDELNDSEIIYEFDFSPNSPTIRQLNLTIRDNNKRAIFALIIGGNSGAFNWGGRMLLVNRDTTIFKNQFKTNADILLDVPDQTGSYTSGGTTYPATTTVADVQTATSTTYLGADFTLSKTYTIYVALNFQTKTITTFKISDKSNPEISATYNNLPFINNSATNLSNFDIVGTRPNSSNTSFNAFIDNLKIYRLIDAATASVTINYKDSEGNLLKTSRVQPDLEVGTTYYATDDDKATFFDDNFYYAYNAAASTDNVVVAEGAVINLIFKKTAKLSGTYIWSGNANSNWNNADENFSVGASPFMGYQDNNPILFPAVPVTKTVNLNANLTIGDNDITMFGDGYNFSGTGSIAGSGKFILGMQAGETTTLGIRNNMSKVEIQGGEAILTNDLGTATYDLADGAKITLQTGAEFNKAITGTGTVTIQTNSNVFYNNTLTGPSTVNLILGVSGSISGGVDWSSKVLTAMPANAQVNVTTTQESAGYGVAANSLQNSKLNLCDNTRLLFNYNPAEGGGTIISVGELNGSSSASIEGGWVNSATRGLNYYIGGLGTDATYNGIFKNYSTAPTAPLNIYKKGAGIWTLNGASPDFILGTLHVDEGTVIMNGSIPQAGVVVNVASGATLKGTGTIGGATTVNGTLEGSLNFGSSLTLNGTTKFVVNGINEGEFDKINVTGAANVGGTIDVTVNIASGIKGVDKVRNANPPIGTRIKLINAGSIVTSLPTVHYPSNGWTFIPATGELVYDPNNVVSGINSSVVPFSIYPTLTRDIVNVEGNVKTIDVFSLTGQRVNSLVANGTKTVVNLNNLSSGAYIIRANMDDGSANMQNVILQK